MATSCELDIDILMKRSNVTYEQLNDKIEEEQLWELAGHLGNYEQYVGVPGFGLNEADKADLKDCVRDNGHQHAMKMAFKKWFNVPHNGVLTYRSLVDILVKLCKFTLVEAVCEIVSRTRPSKTGPNDISLSASASGQIVKGTGDQVKPVSPHSGVADEIAHFEKRFIVLQTAALEEIIDSEISVSKFRHKLMTLPSSIKHENKDFVMSNFHLFEKAESIEFIFLYLDFYLSYIDFSLLEHIIEQFGSERLKEDMSCYAQDMTQFKAKTTISDALKYLPKSSDLRKPPTGFSCFTVKFEHNTQSATLEQLDNYRKTFANEFLLSQLALSLYEVRESSLLVTWLVPTSIESVIVDKLHDMNTSFFLSNNMIELSFSGKLLYSLQNMISQPKRFSKYVYLHSKYKAATKSDKRVVPNTLGLFKTMVSLKEKDMLNTASSGYGSACTDVRDIQVVKSDQSLLRPPVPYEHRLYSYPRDILGFSTSKITELSKYSASVRAVTASRARPHHQSIIRQYLRDLDDDPHRDSRDKISALIESTPDCRGLAIIVPWGVLQLKNIPEFLSGTYKFAVYNPLVDLTPGGRLFPRSTRKNVHIMEYKHFPIVMVISGWDIRFNSVFTLHGWINIKDDIVKPLFSPAASDLADSPKIVLFIEQYDFDPSLIEKIFPLGALNYIVGVISCLDADSVTSAILCALKSPQESVQEIFKWLDSEINQLTNGRMVIIDHLNEPIYLHPDAPAGTDSGPGLAKKLLKLEV